MAQQKTAPITGQGTTTCAAGCVRRQLLAVIQGELTRQEIMVGLVPRHYSAMLLTSSIFTRQLF